ncbi:MULTISPECIES: heme exporter protein CcmD [unclassified Lentilitoribacter]|jgi:heme exporter protein D|uniref:heme exporter protein CcmD n=1 Tax=unclassified Lentilitoribacter TaxID=2647570 RepID=UPI0013A6BC0C|nr:heme exporter protein CcmD [Lentilitoribacter sp. Alg239-R112]
MSHEAFVYTSYGITALTVVGMVLWVILDGRARRRELASLDAAGIKRRSEQS